MCLYFVGDVARHGASDQTRERVHVDLVDFGPPNLDPQHVKNSRPPISLVRSNDQNFILQSANHGVTRDCLWTLR